MTHASVFSGIGGPEVAATMLGWDKRRTKQEQRPKHALGLCLARRRKADRPTCSTSEINPFGRKVLDYWYPNSKSYEDITFERSRQTGSGVSLRAKTNTNYTN